VRKTDLANFAGKVAVGASIAIVLVFIALIVLAVFCVGLGAVSSVTNPHAAQDTQQEYQQLQENISHGQAGISGAVRNTTGG
jgi:Na+-transporting methylmalonyl-CoA/oxaloacetate decarboxylase gamma subunit